MQIEFPDKAPLSYADLVALNAMLIQSQQIRAEKSISWVPSKDEQSELLKFIDMPSPYPGGEKVENKPKEEHKEEHHDWFHDACDWVSGTMDVATQVAAGAVHEVVEAVTEHPLETLGMVAEGVAIGAVIIAAAPIATIAGAGAATVGAIALTADAAIVGLTAVGAVTAGGDVLHAASASEVSADILMHKSEHSAEEIEAARQDVQHKTGKAALEVVATVAAGRSIGGSIDRLSAAADRILPSAEKVLALPAPEKLALPAAQEVLPVTDKISIPKPELPPNSAQQLLNSFDEVLAQRQSQVDLESLTTKLNELKIQNSDKIAINDLENQIVNEFATRQIMLRDVLNKEAPNLFPDSVVPTLKMTRLPEIQEASHLDAGYLEGELFSRQSELIRPSFERNETAAAKMANFLAHEMKHGEQDGLMLRNWIEIATGGDTSGRPLTLNEIFDIQDLGVSKTKFKFSREIIEDVNSKRPGEALSPADVSRAEKLEASRMAQADAKEIRANDRYALKELEEEEERVAKGVTPYFLSESYQSSLFGKGNIPQAMRDIMEQFERLPKSGTRDYTPAQNDFTKALQPTLQRVMSDEVVSAMRRVLNNSEEYRNWFHEIEAYDIGEQATKQIIAGGTSGR